MGCASVMLEQVRNDSRLAPSSLLLGKARERSLLSLNRKVVNSELFCSLSAAFLRAIAPKRLLRATATGKRDAWTSSGRMAIIGHRPLLCRVPTMVRASSLRPSIAIRWTAPLARSASPCAASKHLPEVAFLRTVVLLFRCSVRERICGAFGTDPRYFPQVGIANRSPVCKIRPR